MISILLSALAFFTLSVTKTFVHANKVKTTQINLKISLTYTILVALFKRTVSQITISANPKTKTVALLNL